MGLETASYLTGLTPSWPLPTDRKSVGDDHIRLIKTTLQNTFPNANKAFRFPKAEVLNVSRTIVSTDQNNTIFLDTSGGNLVANLPTGLVSTDDGWWCDVAKISPDANGIIVSPGSGSIISRVGGTSAIRVGIICEPVRFFWIGSAWICYKPGPMIGSTENFDGAALPPGYLLADGSTYSNTLYPELFAILGTTVLRDKRGRVEAGVDGGIGRLGATYFGASPVLGAVGGEESHLLSTTEIPAHTHANALDNATHIHAVTSLGTVAVQNGTGTSQGNLLTTSGGSGVSFNTGATAAGQSITNAAAGGGGRHNVTQPTIVVNKIIRAC